MPHKFHGTWSYFELSKAPFPGGDPAQRKDFRLFIDNAGNFDKVNSRVDGRKIQDASVTGELYFEITAEGRKYKGFFLKEDVAGDGSSTIVMAGRYKDPQAVTPPTKGGKGADANLAAQNEGDWVITKP